jgi:hypothetical protein
MADTAKWKSVGIDISTYNKLRKICECEDRNIRQQISRMVNQEYKSVVGKDYDNMGIGSVGQKNAV